jgi:hypothetical protein
MRSVISKANKSPITFHVEQMFLEDLQTLPWQQSIEEWKELGVKHVHVKRGVGRHPIVFVQVGRRVFVVKELGYEDSLKEIVNFRELLNRGIHTLIPVGSVMREEEPIEVDTQIGKRYERNRVGHTVTLLLDRVVPDSQLYRRAFKFENRKRIWDAIIDLFVELHSRGIYWGDASLANTLVKFLRVDMPYIGRKVELKAFLVDAETVEIHNSISDSLRATDVEFFLESMEWINEDLMAEGILRDPLGTKDDVEYIKAQYALKYEANTRLMEFEKRTGLNVQRLLGKLRVPVEVDLLEKQIEEHKWYLNERGEGQFDLVEAAKRWHDEVFVPICRLFSEEEVPRFFPGKTASELYMEIMTHKYFMSKESGKDVGMMKATRDYIDRFSTAGPLASFWIAFTKKMTRILGIAETGLTGISNQH